LIVSKTPIKVKEFDSKDKVVKFNNDIKLLLLCYKDPIQIMGISNFYSIDDVNFELGETHPEIFKFSDKCILDKINITNKIDISVLDMINNNLSTIFHVHGYSNYFNYYSIKNIREIPIKSVDIGFPEHVKNKFITIMNLLYRISKGNSIIRNLFETITKYFLPQQIINVVQEEGEDLDFNTIDYITTTELGDTENFIENSRYNSISRTRRFVSDQLEDYTSLSLSLFQSSHVYRSSNIKDSLRQILHSLYTLSYFIQRIDTMSFELEYNSLLVKILTISVIKDLECFPILDVLNSAKEVDLITIISLCKLNFKFKESIEKIIENCTSSYEKSVLSMISHLDETDYLYYSDMLNSVIFR